MFWFYLLTLLIIFALGLIAWWRAFRLIVLHDVAHLTQYRPAEVDRDSRLCRPQGLLFLLLGSIWIATPPIALAFGLSLTAVAGLLAAGMGVQWLGSAIIQRSYGPVSQTPRS